MITVNSLSGGKTSSYIAVNYPADYNVFALVRTNDKNCIFPDAKLRQVVSDKIGTEFIGTLEDDMIIYTMLDLEQYIGKEINWVTGKTFDEIIKRGDKTYLPNPTMRFCTTEMKINPMFDWWLKTINKPILMRIGFRANEQSRAKTMLEKLNNNGLMEHKTIIGKSKKGDKNKWGVYEWQKPQFPLINDSVFKDTIEEFWKNKPVRFAEFNNCVGCFHRDIHLLKYVSEKHPNKFDWFIKQEQKSKKNYNGLSWNLKIDYSKIKEYKTQIQLFNTDFNECDSGYCGL